jgi:hypothetical protein
MAGFETVLAALGDDATVVYGGRVVACCPAHDDDSPSLSLKEGEDGRALLYCHAGCDTLDVVKALQLDWTDLFTTVGRDGRGIQHADHYVYVDEQGNRLIRVVRTVPKGFFQERWEEGEWKPGLRDTRRVLYNLPEVLDAASKGLVVYVTEGEKDADNLMSRGVIATTAIGGASKWKEDYTSALQGATVIVVADNDEPGLRSARAVAEATAGTVVLPASGKDATDHLLAGFGVNDFVPDDTDDTFEEWDPWEYKAPEDEWLMKPYVPRASRVLLHGPSGSLKTLWAMWLAVRLAYAGEKVAFMSTEMNRGQAAKRFQRFDKPPAGNLRIFGRFMLGQNLGTAIKNFEGYSLIVVDSWSSTQGDISSNDNDAVARLDVDFFQPLVSATGATVMVIDNTGHDAITADGRVRRDSARGASRKRDIQEVELHFSRPDKDNNFRTSVEVTKMRLDVAIPPKVVIETPQDEIEFYYVSQGIMSQQPFWPGLQVQRLLDEGENSAMELALTMLGGEPSE